MARLKARSHRRWDRSLGVLFGEVVLLLALGLVFSVAHGSRRITTSARSLHDAAEVLRSATIVRAQLAVAGHMVTVDERVGSNSSEAIALSISETRHALNDITTGLEHLNTEAFTTPNTETITTGFVTAAQTIVTLIENNADPVTHQTTQLGDHFTQMNRPGRVGDS